MKYEIFAGLGGNERYLGEVESWLDYRVGEYEEGKDYE